MIALCSPCGMVETGLPICALEKMAGRLAKRVGQDIFSSPVGGPEIAKWPRFLAISNSMQPDFSPSQTEWRRTQSAANPSPLNSLLTGKNTGNLRISALDFLDSISYLPQSTGVIAIFA